MDCNFYSYGKQKGQKSNSVALSYLFGWLQGSTHSINMAKLWVALDSSSPENTQLTAWASQAIRTAPRLFLSTYLVCVSSKAESSSMVKGESLDQTDFSLGGLRINKCPLSQFAAIRGWGEMQLSMSVNQRFCRCREWSAKSFTPRRKRYANHLWVFFDN